MKNDARFYLVLANIIIIFNFIIIIRSIYKVCKRHENIIDWRSSIAILIIFHVVLIFSRFLMFLDIFKNILIIRAICEWIFALIISVSAFKYTNILAYLMNLENLNVYAKMTCYLKEEINARAIIQSQLENQNKHQNNAILKLQHILETEMWLKDRQRTIDELGGVLNELNKCQS